ncbi:MAG: CapA family protein [Candidatus Woesearchaeota archaeon]|nr:CapA family protein [Candidatus Woesearchaeota archaeon]MDP7324144.1 CapA family protein [Candidatus Woesearchaeota archaeon]MDP7458224.1 CapA family protein [Candidatus Woesearchaeota archaeon]
MVTLFAVGDIMLSRGVGNVIDEKGALFPFQKTAAYLKKADLVFGNLESSISPTGKALEGKQYAFNALPESVDGLKSAGIGVVSLANNHILDYGVGALKNTMKILDKNGIAHVGVRAKGEDSQDVVVIKKGGLSIGFLAYSPTFAKQFRGLQPGPFPFYKQKVLKDIKNAREKVDSLIVSLHWGVEYGFDPTERQERLAKCLIDNGVDIVLGHHPHVVQRHEKYKQGVIFYSLGNFIFDQYSHEGVKDSMIARIELSKQGVKDVSVVGLRISDLHQPQFIG